jgi:hypothetical protein
MKTRIRTLQIGLIAITLMAPLSSIEAQFHSAIAPGDEVRVSYYNPAMSLGYGGPSLVTGEVVDVNESGLLLKRGKRFITVPASSLRSVELRVGTRPASAPAMVTGSALGFVAGFALGALTGGFNHMDPNVDRVEAGLTTGVLVGAPAGAIVAWLTSRQRGIYDDIPFGDVLSSMVVGANGTVRFSIPTGSF